MNVINSLLRVMTVIALSWLAVSCSKPEKLTGRINGVWETEWEDYVGEDDIGDIRMKETLVLTPDNKYSDRGKLWQIFIGEVDYDDFEYDETLDFSVAVSGRWRIVDYDNIELLYDLESMRVSTGKSNVEVDCSDAVVDLLKGDLTSAVVGGLMGSNMQNKVNKRINNAASKQIDRYFRNYFKELKHNKKAMKGIKIERDMMNCKINTGFIGREAIYDHKNKAPFPSKSKKSFN